MGDRGPVPNRDADLARDRARNGRSVSDVTKGELRPVPERFLEPDPNWHPLARDLWDGMLASGQSDWYQASDMALAASILDDLSEYKKSSKRSAMMAQVVYSQLSNLLVTEGDRRRARIELSQPKSEGPDATLAVIDGYAAELGIE
jgi:hypothetical protein